VKAGGEQSNRLARNFGLCKKQEGNGRVVTSVSIGFPTGQNETAGLCLEHRANLYRRHEQEFRMALKKGWFHSLICSSEMSVDFAALCRRR
jgi:hypothetical protein